MLISNTVFSWNLNHWTTRDVQFFFFSFLFGSIHQNAKLPHPGIKPMAPVVKAWNCIIWHFAKAHPNVISVTHQSHLCYPLYFLHFRSILLILFLFTTLFPSLHPLYFLIPCVRSIVTVMLESYIFSCRSSKRASASLVAIKDETDHPPRLDA